MTLFQCRLKDIVDEMVRMHDEGAGSKKIGDKFGLHHSTVYYHLGKRGCVPQKPARPRRSPPYPSIPVSQIPDEIVEMYEGGAWIIDLARHFRRTQGTIRKILKDAGVQIRWGGFQSRKAETIVPVKIARPQPAAPVAPKGKKRGPETDENIEAMMLKVDAIVNRRLRMTA